MDIFQAESGRSYTPLPIDNSQGFPQSFSILFGGRTYHFWLYVNVTAAVCREETAFLELPAEDCYLVVRVEREGAGGARETIFLRKVMPALESQGELVVPALEYEIDDFALMFPRQVLARHNLNGQGNFGSQVLGGIAPRWV